MTEEQAKRAVELVREALGSYMHLPWCAEKSFQEQHHYLPTNHPLWKQCPPCDCFIARAAAFLNEID